MLYRVWIECKNDHDAQLIADRVSEDYPGFSLLRARGYWRGIAESSACVEILADDTDRARIRRLSEDLRDRLTQESVLLQEVPVNCVFV